MTSSSREHLTRLMQVCGRDGVLHVRTSGDSDPALSLPQPKGMAMTTPPVTTRLEIQITGIRAHFAECVTEVDEEACGERSACWDNPMQSNTWIRAHGAETGHKRFTRHTEESVSIFTAPTGRQRQRLRN
ncbi:hypothetical protein ACFYWU_33150 [Streptomyces chrestomyceticus]|uniref:hypothetical protein n=1 Tax=Streptomyces chrestomyceticus TaxID=68185 RepID=UPI0036B053A6